MANLIDYIKWRGDIPFSAMPFNEVDGLILSHFSYMPFDGINFRPNYTRKAYTIEKISLLLQDYEESDFHLPNDKEFIQLLGKSVRFKDLRLTNHVRHHINSEVIQFDAITIHISDDEMYISFCGTDATIVGWKDDFYISFMDETETQKTGQAYTKKVMTKYPDKKVHIGGHSKGGNTAVYSAVKLPPEMKERVLDVRNYDGPGFPRRFRRNNDFDSIVDRLSTYVPQDSVFGQIFEHVGDKQVVISNATGILQHDVYSWEVIGKDIVEIDKNSVFSKINYDAISNWLETTSPETRKTVIDIVFDVMMDTNKETVTEIKYEPQKLIIPILKGVYKLSLDDYKALGQILKAFIVCYIPAIRDNLMEESTNKLLDSLPPRIRIMLDI